MGYYDKLSDEAKKFFNEYQKEMRKKRKPLTPEQKKKQAEYLKKWRKENPDKVEANFIRFYEKKAKEAAWFDSLPTEEKEEI